MFKSKPKSIKIVEVGPRDGLQNESQLLKTEDKVRYIELLIQAGLKDIEITSFVNPKSIPQMGDSVELSQSISRFEKSDQLNLIALVPNIMGLENALNSGVKSLAFFTSTSDEFNKKNINCTVDESFSRLKEIHSSLPKDVRFRGYISTVFGCPYEGNIPHDQVLRTMEKMYHFRVDEVSLGDTIGIALPNQVYHLVQKIKEHFDLNQMAMHFHDTRGMGMANVVAALESGVVIYDSSSGGLGGCPYAKGSAGNIGTEDLVYLCEGLEIETGVNLKALVQASQFALEKLSKASASRVYQSLMGEL